MGERSIAILGSTGSIGVSTLSVVEKFSTRFRVCGLAGGDNVELLAEQIDRFKPQAASTRTEEAAEKLRKLLGSRAKCVEILSGANGAERVASLKNVEIVVSAIVGAAGLRPTLAAVEAGKTIALANKESMVVAGALVSREAKRSGSKILPVDSEHNAIFQALGNSPREHVKRLVLTASGGPFFRQPERDLSKVTPAEALNHPNWKMGPKITIDSATLMNKGLEVIEAFWLFGFGLDQIDVVVHPQSVIHSMVEYIDGSVLAQMGVPDMKGPIAFALAYPDRLPNVTESLSFAKVRDLNFFEPDHDRFPSIEIAREALKRGETCPAVLNGSNEVTVKAFLDGKLGFLDIARINREVVLSYRQKNASTLENYLEADLWGREEALRLANSE